MQLFTCVLRNDVKVPKLFYSGLNVSRANKKPVTLEYESRTPSFLTAIFISVTTRISVMMSPVTGLFVQRLVQTNNENTRKLRINGPVWENPPLTGVQSR